MCECMMSDTPKTIGEMMNPKQHENHDQFSGQDPNLGSMVGNTQVPHAQATFGWNVPNSSFDGATSQSMGGSTNQYGVNMATARRGQNPLYR